MTVQYMKNASNLFLTEKCKLRLQWLSLYPSKNSNKWELATVIMQLLSVMKNAYIHNIHGHNCGGVVVCFYIEIISICWRVICTIMFIVSIVYNNQEIKITCPLTDKKDNIVYTHNEMLFSDKKDGEKYCHYQVTGMEDNY